MNVFVLSHDHEERARYHCDTHVNKMLIESAQILNTALHLNDAEEFAFYQQTHRSHPWVRWAASRYENWDWLFDHTTALGEEFLRRSDSETHATIEKIELNWVERFDGREHRRTWISSKFDDDGPRTSFPLCMDDEYADQDDPVTSYRKYYVEEKVPQDWCTWTNGIPEWVLELQ